MSELTEIPQVLHTYLSFWNETDEVRRAAILDECVTDDVIFADPKDYHEGKAELAANGNRLHASYSDLVLSRTSGVDAQNRRHRYTWRIVANGKVLVEGMDVTTLNEDGFIERIDGFFGPIRPHEDASMAG